MRTNKEEGQGWAGKEVEEQEAAGEPEGKEVPEQEVAGEPGGNEEKLRSEVSAESKRQ